MARYSGNAGAVYLKVGGVFTKVLDIYDWTYNEDTTLLRVDIKMDVAERWLPSHVSGAKFTAKRRSEGISQLFLTLVAQSATNATQSTWRLDLIDNNATYVQITGDGYVETGSLNSPQNDAIDETITVQFDDSAVFSH